MTHIVWPEQWTHSGRCEKRIAGGGINYWKVNINFFILEIITCINQITFNRFGVEQSGKIWFDNNQRL